MGQEPVWVLSSGARLRLRAFLPDGVPCPAGTEPHTAAGTDLVTLAVARPPRDLVRRPAD